MSTQLIESHRKDAEIIQSDPSLCKIKSTELLARMNLPKGLLPLDEMTEVGYNESTGFVWLKQKNKTEHKFKAIGRTVSYDKEVTAFVENCRMRKVTGVKSKEILLWITVSEIYINQEPTDSGKITFASTSGLYRSFPISAFEQEEEQET